MSVVRCHSRNGEFPFAAVAERLLKTFGSEGRRLVKIHLRYISLPTDWSNAIFSCFLTETYTPRQEIFERPEAAAYRPVFQSWLMQRFGNSLRSWDFHFFLCNNTRLGLNSPTFQNHCMGCLCCVYGT